MGSHSTSGHTEGTESASPSPSPHRSPHHSARSSRAGATDTFPRTVSTQKAPQVDPSPPIHIGKFAPLPLPKIPTKSETFAPPHFRPADGRPTPLQPFRLRLQGFRSVGLPSAPPTLRAGPDHTPPQIISNQTIPDPPRLSRRVTAMREDFSGFEMREVVGDFMETPSWGSAFPGGEAARDAVCEVWPRWYGRSGRGTVGRSRGRGRSVGGRRRPVFRLGRVFPL